MYLHIVTKPIAAVKLWNYPVSLSTSSSKNLQSSTFSSVMLFQLTFKLASITFKTLHTCQLGYLRELLHFCTPARNFRSSNQGLLSVSRTRTVLASHGFRHSAVSVWNDLPAYIRNVSTISSFKHNLDIFVHRCLCQL